MFGCRPVHCDGSFLDDHPQMVSIQDLPRVLVMMIERRRITYAGRVQGVGFRMTARRLSSALPVSGYVRNQPDGRVEMVVEGEPEILSSYLQAVHHEFGDMIRDIDEVVEPPDGEPFVGFTIRY
jgi:acylphosphatase